MEIDNGSWSVVDNMIADLEFMAIVSSVYRSALVTKGISARKTCQYMDKGIMELTQQGFKQRSIDFGDSMCGDKATFTVNENTVAFRLK